MGAVRFPKGAGNHRHNQGSVRQAGGESTNGTPLTVRTPSVWRPWGESQAPTQGDRD